jgi:hypothetical protein
MKTSDDIPPGPFSEHELQEQWNQQADEHSQWGSLDSSEQLAWAQACAIAWDRKAAVPTNGSAADLLAQRHPAPVLVSERLPRAEDCDAEGRCWWFNRWAVPEWQLSSDGPYGDAWLPFPAIPLPAGEGKP